MRLFVVLVGFSWFSFAIVWFVAVFVYLVVVFSLLYLDVLWCCLVVLLIWWFQI